MALHRWKRSAGLVLGLAVLGAAPAAQAADVTNPAKNPAPITLTIDGQTYRDGLDTLPGYDDYACTPIPNVEYDFAGNQIQYYDGQGELVKTATWTEWSRISSYETWVAQQQQGGKPPSTSTTTTPAKPAPAATTTSTSTTTTSPAAAAPADAGPTAASPTTKTTSATAKTKRSATKTKRSATTTKRSATKTKTASTTSAASQGSTGSRTPSSAARRPKKRGGSTASPAKRRAAAQRSTAAASTVGTTASEDGTSTASTTSPDDVATSAQAGDAPTAAADPSGAPKYELVSNKGVGAGMADTRPVGVGILVAVFGVACLAFLFGSARRRRSFGRVAP